RLNFNRLGVDDGGSDVAEGLVHGVSPGVDYRRLLLPRDDDARAAMRLKVANQCLFPFVVTAGRSSPRGLHSQTPGYYVGEALHFAWAERQPVICHGACHGGRAFHGIEPVHLSIGSEDSPLAGKIARIANTSRTEK